MKQLNEVSNRDKGRDLRRSDNDYLRSSRGEMEANSVRISKILRIARNSISGD
ncbi:hypothetical protein ACQPZX_02710 [Actinoplanes sp. CA-142083]|uniref:hypothetical protein n=1 Tax=Actinoplanes sp. CA-142083 TaxID=3239903 RepID=UPI003D93AEFD